MARDWSDLFLTDGARPAAAAAAAAEDEPARKRGFFRKLRSNLSKTREALGAEIQATLLEGDVDEETWERLEEALIMADVGAATTARVVGELEAQASGGEISGGEALSHRMAQMLAEGNRRGGPHRPAPLADGDHGGRRQRHRQDDDDRQARLAPAAGARPEGRARRRRHVSRRRRAAARGAGRERAGCEIVSRPRRDPMPGSVAYDAIKQGRERGADVVIIDTAGRLHTQDNLMAELTKVRRVISKQIEDAPHETLLTGGRDDRPERAAPGQALLRGGAGRAASSSPSSTAPPRAASRSRSPVSSASR